MGIFDWLSGKKKKENSISEEDFNEMMDDPNIEVKINTDDLPESPVKSIDDLDLDPETMEKLKSMTVQVGEDGVLPKVQNKSSNPERNYFEDGTYFEKSQNGELTKIKHFNEKGILLREGNTKLDEKEGLWISYHPNGEKFELENFKDGLLHGISEWYNEEGILRGVVNWSNGKENGPYINYNEDGKEQEKGNYKNGKLIS